MTIVSQIKLMFSQCFCVYFNIIQSELNEICEKGTESEKRIEVLQLHNDVLE